MSHPVALITGGARRIGAEIAKELHCAGYNVILHYRQSAANVQQLCQRLNRQRPESARVLQADLLAIDAVENLAAQAVSQWQRLDALINNASSFYPTPVGTITLANWQDLLGTNLQAPLFLSQACAPSLKQNRGSIINIADVHGERPLSKHTVYCLAKAGNIMLTKSLAKELAPDIRVNGIAPGTILWPEDEGELPEDIQAKILKRIALERVGDPTDIAKAIKFLLLDAPYITGQILAVDGGRNLVS
jgi:pteridine reductase